ncbi:MAG: type II secretion system F family protein [Fimbriimonadales bacterium]
MHAFKYKGYDAAGQPVTGEMTAASIDEVERRMMNRQITLVVVKPTRARAERGSPTDPRGIWKRSRRVSDAEAAKILSNLSVMVAAGVPFVEALDALASTATREVIVKGIQDLKNQIIEGQSLAGALRSATTLFPEMVADLVRVAEEGGSLASSLSSAGSFLARRADLRRKVKNAMLYPAVMLVVSFLTVLVLVVFVMPKFMEVFQEMHADIPITTRLMINAGNLIRGEPWQCLSVFVALIVAAKFASRNEYVAAGCSKLAVRLPGVGDLLSKLALSRALQSMSALISGNVPLVLALEHGAKVAGNPQLSDAIRRSLKSVEEGETLFAAFAEHKAFPPVLTQMIGVGEKTGHLASMMTLCAEEMETETDARLKSLIAIIEPLMIVVMGVLVGTITVSIITPIYSAVQHIR